MDHLCDLHRHYLTECLLNQKVGRLSRISLWGQNQSKPTKTKNLRKDTQYENYSFVLRVQFIGIRTLWYYTPSSLHLQPFTSSQSITILLSVSSSGSPTLPPAPAHSTCASTHHLLSGSESRCCHYYGLSTPGHFCLGSFTVHDILKAHPHQDSVKFPSGLNNIPLYVYIYHISPPIVLSICRPSIFRLFSSSRTVTILINASLIVSAFGFYPTLTKHRLPVPLCLCQHLLLPDFHRAVPSPFLLLLLLL